MSSIYGDPRTRTAGRVLHSRERSTASGGSSSGRRPSLRVAARPVLADGERVNPASARHRQWPVSCWPVCPLLLEDRQALTARNLTIWLPGCYDSASSAYTVPSSLPA